jgi:nicotinamidase-related amidase
MDRDTWSGFTTQDLHTALTEIMDDMDFDAIAAHRATEKLNDMLFGESHSRVVVTGIATDDGVPMDESGDNSRHNFMQRIFSNMN